MGQTSHRPLLGIGLYLAAMLLFPFLDTVAKFLGEQDFPVLELVWARLLFAVLAVGPLLAATEGIGALRPRNVPLNIARGLIIVVSTLCFFWALKFQGIAETLALYFVGPLVTAVAAPLLLHEKVGLERWLLVLAGFCAMLLIVRPGFQAFNPGMALAIASGIGSGFALVLTRKAASQASALANSFYVSLFGLLIATAVVLPVWQTPTQPQLGWLLVLGLIGTTATYFTILAPRYAEASLLAPVGYAEMINAVLCGWYFFGDFPDGWTFAGVALLIAGTTFVSLRERGRSPPANPAPGTG